MEITSIFYYFSFLHENTPNYCTKCVCSTHATWRSIRSNSLDTVVTFQDGYLNLNVMHKAHLTLALYNKQAALVCYIVSASERGSNFRRFITIQICRFVFQPILLVVSDTVTLFYQKRLTLSHCCFCNCTLASYNSQHDKSSSCPMKNHLWRFICTITRHHWLKQWYSLTHSLRIIESSF